MNVINTIVYRGNPYNRVLYGPEGGRYAMVAGTVAGAIEALRFEPRPILHLHWEEGFLRECRTPNEAEAAAYSLAGRIQAFVGAGGRLVWTVHNAMPHELEYAELFLRLRAFLARVAARITVHGLSALPTLGSQVALDPARVALVPHPSYLGVYEAEAETLSHEPDWESRRLLFFGRLRPYKGADLLLEAAGLVPDIEIDIVGEPMAMGDDLAPMLERIGEQPQLHTDLRRIDDAEIPARMRGCRGLVLPYRRFLTSGVAMLAMTYGCPIVAPDLPQMRELLPASAHRLLYADGDAAALAQKMRLLRDMPLAERRVLRAELLEQAVRHSPARVSGRLFELFDGM